MRILFFIFLFLQFVNEVYTQNDFDYWNNNYNEIDVNELIDIERHYADSIANNNISDDYFLRMGVYRFSAIYLGEKREINAKTKASMRRVYKLMGNPDYISIIDDVKYEYQFKIDTSYYWFPLQKILDKPFKKEISKNNNVYLYCLFLNEFTNDRELYNTFLISEFYKE